MQVNNAATLISQRAASIPQFDIDYDNLNDDLWLSMYDYKLCLPDDPAEVRQRAMQSFLRCIMVHPFSLRVPSAGKRESYRTSFVPGHEWTKDLLRAGSAFSGLYYPRRSDVMIIGKCMTQPEYVAGVHFTDDAGRLLAKQFVRRGISFDSIYVTNVVKFCPRTKLNDVPAPWVRMFKQLLDIEIQLVRPKYILLCGSAPLKVLFGNSATLKKYAGRVLEYAGAKLMVIASPSDALRNPERMPGLLGMLGQFFDVMTGKYVGINDCSYTVLRDEQSLAKVVDELIAKDVRRIAVDCEWAGDAPWFKDSYLLTVQFACAVDHAYVVALRSDVSGTQFSPMPSRAFYHLRRLLCRPGVQICGHNFRSDMLWLNANGIDLADQFAECGFDTMLANHLLAENSEHDLTSCVLRFTQRGRYDAELSDIVARVGSYAQVPDDVLYQYGANDAAAVYELTEIYTKLLWNEHCTYADRHALDPNEIDMRGKDMTKQWYPTVWNLYWCLVMAVTPALHEIERSGILTDFDRLRELSRVFVEVRDEVLAKLRGKIHNQQFNPRSSGQVAWLLFGPAQYEDKNGVSMAGLGLTPIKSTGKPAQQWEKLVRNGLVRYSDEHGWLDPGNKYAPSTDSETLGALADSCEEAELLRQYRFLDQIIKSFIRQPEIDGSGEEVYEKGLLSFRTPEGRIHTSLSQLTETGRYRSSKPNLQNLPKSRESDLYAIFESYGRKIDMLRSGFIPDPGGVFLEGDLSSAELYTLAYIAHDDVMKEDLERRDSNGNKISLHSTVAVQIFRLNIDIEEFERIRSSDTAEAKRFDKLRTAAKTVNFGIPYQRSGRAIARAVMREGMECSEEDGNTWVDEWYARYTKAAEFIDFCKRSVYDPGVLATLWGRMRHFYRVKDESVMAAQQREACNFPIQSTVADTITRGLTLLYHKRNMLELPIWIRLTVHDSVMLWAPYKYARAARDLLVSVLSNIEVPGTGLRYDVDIDVFERWGVKASPAVLEKCGLLGD